MSRRDGIGEIDGWCHECGLMLDDPYSGMTDLCKRCARLGLDHDPETVRNARAFWKAAAERELDDDEGADG